MNKEILKKLSRKDLEDILTEVYKKLDSSAKDNYYNKIHADYYPEIIKGKFKTMVNFVDALIVSKQISPEPMGILYHCDFKYPDKISLDTFLKNKYNILCSITCDAHLTEELWGDIIDNIDFKKFVENINEYETLSIELCNCNFIETGRNWKVLINLNFERKSTQYEIIDIYS